MLFHLAVMSQPETEMGVVHDADKETTRLNMGQDGDGAAAEEKKPPGNGAVDASDANKNNNQGGCDCCDCCRSCCSSFCNFIQKYWMWIVGVLVVVAIAIILAIALPLALRKRDVKPTTPPPVDTTATTKPVVPTTTPYPGKLIQGDIVTTENYTVGLDDPSSAAFLTFEKNFTNAMKTFYDGTAFSALYDGVSIVQLSNRNRQVEISFEVRVSELVAADRPNAHTVLEAQLQTNSLGKFRVISHSPLIIAS